MNTTSHIHLYSLPEPAWVSILQEGPESIPHLIQTSKTLQKTVLSTLPLLQKDPVFFFKTQRAFFFALAQALNPSTYIFEKQTLVSWIRSEEFHTPVSVQDARQLTKLALWQTFAHSRYPVTDLTLDSIQLPFCRGALRTVKMASQIFSNQMTFPPSTHPLCPSVIAQEKDPLIQRCFLQYLQIPHPFQTSNPLMQNFEELLRNQKMPLVKSLLNIHLKPQARAQWRLTLALSRARAGDLQQFTELLSGSCKEVIEFMHEDQDLSDLGLYLTQANLSEQFLQARSNTRALIEPNVNRLCHRLRHPFTVWA